MVNWKAYLLADCLDVYMVSSFKPFKMLDSNISQQPLLFTITTTETSNSNLERDWIGDNCKTGKLGEEIALRYLKSKYNNVTLVSENAQLGYDILADQRMFEVKTSISTNHLFVSKNEIYTAYANKTSYNLFFIKNPEKNPIGYIISDIFISLGIDFEKLASCRKIYDNKQIKMTTENYGIEFSDEYLSSLFQIDLSKFI